MQMNVVVLPARSVAVEISRRQDVFSLRHFCSKFMIYYGEISLYSEFMMGNKMSGKKEEQKGILFEQFSWRKQGEGGGGLVM